MEVTLITLHGFIHLKNPTSFWVDKLFLHPGYGLFYEDDEWKRKQIYNSTDRDLLLDIKDKIIDEIVNGNTKIDIR